jgi:nitroimidazol reductase NimA-like FMN-containing flavoprotein (pyridoxamine 5'-phosphate oxidase superfamily)
MTNFVAEDTDQLAKINQYLAEPLLAHLATVSIDGCQPHVVPVWFDWDGQSLYISSYISTRKMRELATNPKISVAIDTVDSLHGLTAVVMEGQAEIFAAPAEFVQMTAARIYTKYMGPEGVLAKDPQEWIHSPENRIIKLTPAFLKAW